MADVWIINGIPGSGKSTLARRLAARLERGAHVEGDRLHDMIVAGKVLPGEDPQAESERQIHLNVRNQCLLACSFAREDFTPVLDYVVVSRARLEEYRRQLPDLVIRFVTLAPGTEVALERDRKRPEKTVAVLWVHLEAEIEAELQGVGLWVDNARMTVDETVSFVLGNAERARV
ncbi:MAG TPA: AAA family ATPase [Ardenticatenaceae bacterium]|nr:AAA family ATPase [Ardenticatenaceae bacterium]